MVSSNLIVYRDSLDFFVGVPVTPELRSATVYMLLRNKLDLTAAHKSIKTVEKWTVNSGGEGEYFLVLEMRSIPKWISVEKVADDVLIQICKEKRNVCGRQRGKNRVQKEDLSHDISRDQMCSVAEGVNMMEVLDYIIGMQQNRHELSSEQFTDELYRKISDFQDRIILKNGRRINSTSKKQKTNNDEKTQVL